MPTYATPAQLADHLAPEAPPAGAGRLLARASRDVGRALLCARYDVDDDGLPTDTAIVTALREATLEQAAYRLETGDETGLVTPVASASIGSVSLSRGSGAAGGSGSGAVDLGAQAYQVLMLAGLTGQGPLPDRC